MFENKMIKGIYATRYIMSWIREGGNLKHGRDCDDFKEWLKSLGLNEDEVHHIWEIATNGKMELEDSARKFLATKK
jgi:hypothetical protein